MSVINHGQARRIAAEWYSPGSPQLVALATAGPDRISDREALRDEITAELMQLEVGIVRRDLLALDKWVRHTVHVGGTLPALDNYWWTHNTEFDYTPVTIDQV